MTKHATREEWYLSEEIKTGEKTMTCPVSGREYRVTRWASRGDSVVALEKEPVEGTVATDGGAELGVVCDVDDCETRIVGLENGWEMTRGTVCQDCIDYQSRHGHWPDESVDICAECRIDDGMVPHECEESAADRVLIEPGSSCDYCGFEAAMTDGGQPAEDGQAIPRSVGGWELTESSKRSNRPGANYEHPHQDRVYVNIYRPDVVSSPGLWKAKYNDHTDGVEVIEVQPDFEVVRQAAINWMEENPADADRSGQRKLVTDGGEEVDHATYRIYDDPVVTTTDESAAKAAEELGYPVNELRHMAGDGPAMYGATVTMQIAEWNCSVCDTDDSIVSREDSEWVCLRCGMSVDEDIAEIANERLEAGDFQRGRIEKEVDDLARTVVPDRGATFDA